MGLFMSNASRLGSFFKSGSLSQLGSFLGSIGIAGSLLLVAYELKQSREIAELQFAYQRYVIDMDVGTKPTDLTRLEFDHLYSLAMEQGIDALNDEQKMYWADATEAHWQMVELKFETNRKGFLNSSIWFNEEFFITWMYCEEGWWETMTYNIYEPMFSHEFWAAIEEIKKNADCTLFTED